MKKITQWIIVVWILGIWLFFSNKSSAQAYLLGMVDVHFCNYDQTNKELDLISKAGEKFPICIEYTNKSTESIAINVEFLDSIITSDDKKNRACNASDRPKTQFGNFLLPYSKEIRIPWWESIQKKYTIEYPIGFSWLSHGCLAYNIAWGDIEDSSMFTVRIRSIKYLDIYVSETKAVQVISLSQSPTISKIDNEYIISFWIKNEGNLPEKIHITSILSNILWYQKEFNFDTILEANTGIIFTTPRFILPVYGGPFWFTNTISYSPEFNFNITDGTNPSEMYAWGTKKTHTLLFVRSRQSWVALLILLLIIIWIFRTRKRPQSKKNETQK